MTGLSPDLASAERINDFAAECILPDYGGEVFLHDLKSTKARVTAIIGKNVAGRDRDGMPKPDRAYQGEGIRVNLPNVHKDTPDSVIDLVLGPETVSIKRDKLAGEFNIEIQRPKGGVWEKLEDENIVVDLPFLFRANGEKVELLVRFSNVTLAVKRTANKEFGKRGGVFLELREQTRAPIANPAEMGIRYPAGTTESNHTHSS